VPWQSFLGAGQLHAGRRIVEHDPLPRHPAEPTTHRCQGLEQVA